MRDAYFGFYPTTMAAYENDYSTPDVQAAYLDAFDRCLAIRYNARQGPNWIEEFLAWASPDCVTGSLIGKCGAELNCNTNANGYFDAGQAEFERCVNDWYVVFERTCRSMAQPRKSEIVRLVCSIDILKILLLGKP